MEAETESTVSHCQHGRTGTAKGCISRGVEEQIFHTIPNRQLGQCTRRRDFGTGHLSKRSEVYC